MPMETGMNEDLRRGGVPSRHHPCLVRERCMIHECKRIIQAARTRPAAMIRWMDLSHFGSIPLLNVRCEGHVPFADLPSLSMHALPCPWLNYPISPLEIFLPRRLLIFLLESYRRRLRE